MIIDRFIDDNRNHLFLSNFYSSPIRTKYYSNALNRFEDLVYPSVENFYQAAKSHDEYYKREVSLVSPGKAKRLGRTVELRSDWEVVKLDVMRYALNEKFPALNDKNSVNVGLSQQLLDTDDAYLVEGNTWGDRYWGAVDGAGKNWLGILLMARRTQLRHFATMR